MSNKVQISGRQSRLPIRRVSDRLAINSLALLLLVALGVTACGTTRHVDRIQTRAIHPMSGYASQPIPALTGFGPGKEGQEQTSTGAKTETGRAREAVATSGGVGGKGAATGAASGRVAGSGARTGSPSMVPASGDARVNFVESARRLIGVKGSFDERSFLGHVLRINDRLPDGTRAAKYSVGEHRRRAAETSDRIAVSDVRPGDLVLFRCPRLCGFGADGTVTAGVVEENSQDRLLVIAYVDSMVRRCGVGRRAREPGIWFLENGVIEAIRTWR